MDDQSVDSIAAMLHPCVDANAVSNSKAVTDTDTKVVTAAAAAMSAKAVLTMAVPPIDDVAKVPSIAVHTVDDALMSSEVHPSTPHAATSAQMPLPATPKYIPSCPLSCSSFIPECQESLKPVVGMAFDSIDDVEKFYKSYAHEARFSVRIGQHKKRNEEIFIKRYYCSREGYSNEKGTQQV
ncbi:hypothetical protein BS78_02G075700 [Paspalum vaginatum]|nr:hypothetical protein BS78_02G075700 [Paspalum vaginatum]